MAADEYVTVLEAAQLLGVSRWKIWRLAKQKGLETFGSELDKRQTLFRRSDILALAAPARRSPAGPSA